MRWIWMLGLVGCFRAPEDASSPLELRLSDRAGIAVASEEAPRDLELSLSFAGMPDDAEPWLLRGLIDAELLPRLSFARPSAALTAQLVALDVERAPHALRSHPLEPLRAGRYTLVWPYGEPHAFPFAVSSSPALGARWVESFPGDGATHVPPNLAQVLVRFDGHAQGTLALHADGFRARVERCGAHGLPEGDCVWLTPEAALPAGPHTLILEPGSFTPGGAPIPEQRATFEVAGEPDVASPALAMARCALDERASAGACVRTDGRQLWVHGRTDEPCAVSLRVGQQRAMALSFAGEFALALAPRVQGAASLLLRDLAGNERTVELTYQLAELAEVAIDELRADPLGPEPAQEYVELLNFGPETVSLMGFTLSTDAFDAGRTLAASTLAPGERALAVGPDFDPRSLSDGPLPSGVKLIPLSGSLGLANAGGALFLRDARGRRLSSARSLAPLLEGQCSHRVGAEAWELDAHGGCTPGAASP